MGGARSEIAGLLLFDPDASDGVVGAQGTEDDAAEEDAPQAENLYETMTCSSPITSTIAHDCAYINCRIHLMTQVTPIGMVTSVTFLISR